MDEDFLHFTQKKLRMLCGVKLKIEKDPRHQLKPESLWMVRMLDWEIF